MNHMHFKKVRLMDTKNYNEKLGEIIEASEQEFRIAGYQSIREEACNRINRRDNMLIVFGSAVAVLLGFVAGNSAPSEASLSFAAGINKEFYLLFIPYLALVLTLVSSHQEWHLQAMLEWQKTIGGPLAWENSLERQKYVMSNKSWYYFAAQQITYTGSSVIAICLSYNKVTDYMVIWIGGILSAIATFFILFYVKYSRSK